MVKNKIKRLLPLLLALVVLISCLPVLPVLAADMLSGVWYFNSVLDLGAGFYLYDEFSFTSYSVTYSSFEIDSGDVYYNSTHVYSGSSGWLNDNYLVVDFGSSGVSVSDDFYSWFTHNASPYEDLVSLYATTVYIDSLSYVFSDTAGSSPDVSVTVTAAGCTMTGSTTSRWTYSGSETFLGFSLSPSATTPDYAVGETFVLSGCSGSDASYSLYPVTISSSTVTTYYTYVSISGTKYSFAGSDGSSPAVTLSVSADGVTMTDGSTTKTWYAGDNFEGLSSVNGGALVFAIGDEAVLSGSSGSNVSYTFYSVVTATETTYFKTTINVGSSSVVCSGASDYSPDVRVEVLSTGVRLCYTSAESGIVYRTISLSKSGMHFLGLSVSPDATSPDFAVGESFTCPGADESDLTYTFYPVYDSSLINVVFIDGMAFSFSGTEGASPDVTLDVFENSVKLTGADVSKLWYFSRTFGASIQDFAQLNEWVSGEQYYSFVFDQNVSVLASAGNYNGGYYSTDQTWRIYQSDNGFFQIDAGDYYIRSVTIVYSSGNYGTLVYDGVNYASGVTIPIDDHSAIFRAGNLYDATNGQVKIKSITVDYSVTTTDAEFLGLSTTEGGAIVFSPGNSYTLPGASGSDVDWQLFSYADDGIDNYTTIVNVAGDVFSFSSTVSMPVVSVRVTEYGLSLSDGSKTEYWYPNGVLEFLGLAVQVSSSEADYPPGETIVVSGSSSVVGREEILQVYYFPIYGEKSNLLPGADFASWLVVAVGGFLAFELVPGFSLQDILSFVLLFGILLWVLKIALR